MFYYPLIIIIILYQKAFNYDLYENNFNCIFYVTDLQYVFEDIILFVKVLSIPMDKFIKLCTDILFAQLFTTILFEFVNFLHYLFFCS